MSDMLKSLCNPGEPARIVIVTVTDREGAIMDRQGFQIPARVEHVRLTFGYDEVRVRRLNIGQAMPGDIIKAS